MRTLGIIVALLSGCKGAPEPSTSSPADTDADSDTDTDTDTDADTDTDTDTDSDTDLDTGSVCDEDPFEDNDTLEDAAATTGQQGLWVRLGDPDFWSFEVPHGHEVRVTASHDWALGDIDVYVLNSHGDLVGQTGATVANEERATACNAGPTATYFAYVEIWSASLAVCNTYDLSIQSTYTGCPVDHTGDTGLVHASTADTGNSGGSTGDTGRSAHTGSL